MNDFVSINGEKIEAEKLEQFNVQEVPVNIDVDNKLSIEEADSVFEKAVSSVFEKAVDNNVDLAEIDENTLFNDLYIHTEDDFTFEDFPMDDEELNEMLDNFKPENWEKMDTLEREAAVKEVVAKIADLLGIENPPKVQFYNGEYYQYGFFSPSDNSVNFNLAHLDDPKDTLDTAAHETRHAYQNMRGEIAETYMDLLYKINNENYIRSEVSFDLYESQLIEAEARSFASQITSRMEGDY